MTIKRVSKYDRELLPTCVRPLHYTLRMTPNLEEKTFKGVVVIIMKVLQSTNILVLNTNELSYTSATLDNGALSTSIDIDEKSQRVHIKFAEALTVRPCTSVRIVFSGILNDKMAGFYASAYEVNGVNKTMAVTQFEAVDARRAFPCWDEPSLKATFAVTLVVPKHLVAISNMPEKSVTADTDVNLVVREFERTPIMSTYLLAFVIGEFDMIEKATTEGVNIRCFTPKGKSIQGQFGLDVAVRALEFYNQYFEIEYPLPKLDLIAIPDFAAGAMENWGLVTYRSTALLVDPHNSSASTRQWVALVVAHELAHQWFGNLVTMEWWTDLWLNEGFATWVEYLAVDHLFPEWKIWAQFVYLDFGRAMQLDALKNSHPIEVEISKANDVDEIFDHISYCKGSSVIRMLVDFLGEEPFRVGMVKYLQRFKYENASTNHLWEVLGISAAKPVLEVMNCWTRQQGYPVLMVDKNESIIEVRQQRFLVNGCPKDALDTWTIPLIVVSSSQCKTVVDTIKESNASITLPAGTSWVKMNAGQSGIYRVLYSAAMLRELESALNAGLLTEATDRLGIENDAIALARAGLLNTTEVLSLLASGYKIETNYTVWADLLANAVAEIDTILRITSLYEKFKLFVQDLLITIVDKVQWSDTHDTKSSDGESHLVSLLRSLVIPKLGLYGHQGIIKEALKRFDEFVESGFQTGISPDLRTGVFSIALIERKSAAYDILLSLYRTSDLQEEKVRVLQSLGKVPDINLLQQTLDFAFSDEVRSQDVMFIVGSVASNPLGIELAWKWLTTNWSSIVKKFGSGFTISRLITYATINFTSIERADEVSSFFEANHAPGGERAVKQAIEKIRSNAAWLQRDYDAINVWLNTRF